MATYTLSFLLGEKVDIFLHMVIERCLVWVDPFKITILHKLNHA